jgi:hypothetical protein
VAAQHISPRGDALAREEMCRSSIRFGGRCSLFDVLEIALTKNELCFSEAALQ